MQSELVTAIVESGTCLTFTSKSSVKHQSMILVSQVEDLDHEVVGQLLPSVGSEVLYVGLASESYDDTKRHKKRTHEVTWFKNAGYSVVSENILEIPISELKAFLLRFKLIVVGSGNLPCLLELLKGVHEIFTEALQEVAFVGISAGAMFAGRVEVRVVSQERNLSSLSVTELRGLEIFNLVVMPHYPSDGISLKYPEYSNIRALLLQDEISHVALCHGGVAIVKYIKEEIT